MKKIGIVITLVVTSMFLFPFEFTFLPGSSTKRLLAIAGVIVLIYESSRSRNAIFNRNVLSLSIIAVIVSLCGLFSSALNETPDYTYASYIVSMWVWLSAGYFVVKLINSVHGQANVWILGNYLIGVCVFQCLAAILIDRYDSVESFVDTYIYTGQDVIKSMLGMKRKYGIGAIFDVAGSRFSAVIVILAYFLTTAQNMGKTKWIPFYAFSFFFIAYEGNVIGRTTTIGVILSCIWFTYQLRKLRFSGENLHRNALSWSASILVVSSCFLITMYHVDDTFKEDLRFGFEGFFSLWEKGSWEVASNEKLTNMYVFPDNLKTWIIGDGYFSSPRDTDPYFTGELVGGYYMGTDVGYLRFIFYFGLIGLSAISAVMIKSAMICYDAFKEYKPMFIALLAVNFIVWFKVSTDIFPVFAPFIALSAIKQTDPQKRETALSFRQ